MSVRQSIKERRYSFFKKGFHLTGTVKRAGYLCPASTSSVVLQEGRLKEGAFIHCLVPGEKNLVLFFSEGPRHPCP